jgi:diguanylate cyclase (GGDEF)-like protein/PAS domain S-box-containing protein
MRHLHKLRGSKTVLNILRKKAISTVLYDIALGLLNHLDLTGLLEMVVVEATKLIKTKHGYYNLVEFNQDQMIRKVGVGIYQIDVNRVMRLDQGLIQRTIKTGEISIIDDYSSWKNRLNDPFFDEIHTEMQVPIKIGHKIVGVLGLSFIEPDRRFTVNDVAVFQQFATIASMAIYNAILYSTAQTENEERKKLQENLLQITDTMQDVVAKLNHQGVIEYITPSCKRLTGYDFHQLTGKHFHDFIHPDDVEECRASFASFVATNTPRSVCYRYIHASGKVGWLESLREKLYEGGIDVGVVFTARDVTDRIEAEQEAAVLQANYQAIFSSVNDGIIIYDIETLSLIEANQKACEIFGHSKDNLLLTKLQDFGTGESPYTQKESLAWFQKAIQGETPLYDWKIKNSHGKYLDLEVSLKHTMLGGKWRMLTVVRDISERQCAKEKIYRLANFDMLTKLPNRTLFNDRLHIALAHAKRNREQLAVLFLDLDRFKIINDSLGHHVGDFILQEVAERLQLCIRDEDTVCRMSADEFIILLTDIEKHSNIIKIITRMVATLSMPFIVEENELRVTSSIGISIYPHNGHTPEVLVKHAELAMYHGKENGRNNYQFFTESLNKTVTERLSLENSLRLAIERNEFVLYYQPQIDIKTNTLIGVEALIRWNHPKDGLISPSKFISIAEETGLIIPIGEWVLREVCRQHLQWINLGLPAIQIAINVSAIQFQEKQFLFTLQEIVRNYNIDPIYLELELTEGILMRDADAATKELSFLKELGVKLSIDDFGTGYSSLQYLSQFPIDKLKIDQSFIRAMTTHASSLTIVESIISLAEKLHIKVIAEGVETNKELKILQKCGCNEIQGYYFSKPLPAYKFVEWFYARYQGTVNGYPNDVKKNHSIS